MDATLAAILTNVVSSKIYDTLRSGYRKLTETLPVQKAISVTAERFPKFDALRFALTSWCDSPAFGDLVERLKFSPLSDTADAAICQSFLDNSSFYSDDAEADARDVLHVFVLAYMEAVYEGDQGPAVHAMRDLVDNARTHAGLERIDQHLTAQTDQISAQLAAIQ